MLQPNPVGANEKGDFLIWDLTLISAENDLVNQLVWWIFKWSHFLKGLPLNFIRIKDLRFKFWFHILPTYSEIFCVFFSYRKVLSNPSWIISTRKVVFITKKWLDILIYGWIPVPEHLIVLIFYSMND